MPTTENCINCSCSPYLYTLFSVKGALSIVAAAILVEGILNLIKTGIYFLVLYQLFFQFGVWLTSQFITLGFITLRFYCVCIYIYIYIYIGMNKEEV